MMNGKDVTNKKTKTLQIMKEMNNAKLYKKEKCNNLHTLQLNNNNKKKINI